MFVKALQLESHVSQRTTDHSFCYEYNQAEYQLWVWKQKQCNSIPTFFNSSGKEFDLLYQAMVRYCFVLVNQGIWLKVNRKWFIQKKILELDHFQIILTIIHLYHPVLHSVIYITITYINSSISFASKSSCLFNLFLIHLLLRCLFWTNLQRITRWYDGHHMASLLNF